VFGLAAVRVLLHFAKLPGKIARLAVKAAALNGSNGSAGGAVAYCHWCLHPDRWPPDWH